MEVIRKPLLNGEPWSLEDTGVYYHFCCDCNLTHMVTVSIDYKKKKVELKFYRDDHHTKEYRKKERIVVYKNPKKILKRSEK